jgi:hypothetical protein
MKIIKKYSQYELLDFKEILDKTLIDYVTEENAMDLYELAVRHDLATASKRLQRFVKE